MTWKLPTHLESYRPLFVYNKMFYKSLEEALENSSEKEEWYITGQVAMLTFLYNREKLK